MHSVVILMMPFLCVLQKEEVRPVEKEKEVRPKDSGPGLSVDMNHDDYYFPSVDLLTAQVHTQKALAFSCLKHVLNKFQSTLLLHCFILLLHMC